MKDNKNTLVSIIYIAYDQELYIGKALYGFVMKNAKSPFESIVHDDASTDKTASIIMEYKAKYSGLFIAIYQTENQYSRKGLNIWTDITFPKVHGKYIALCEGDDYWSDPNKILYIL